MLLSELPAGNDVRRIAGTRITADTCVPVIAKARVVESFLGGLRRRFSTKR